MTVGIFKQLRLVLWKNYILQKRRKIGTVVELVLPVFFFAILCVIRAVISASQEPAEIYAPIPVHLTTKQIFNDSSLFSATSQFRSICGKNLYVQSFDLPNRWIGYTPPGGDVDKLIDLLKNATGYTFKAYATEKDLVAASVDGVDSNNTVAGIVFSNLLPGNTFNKNIAYSLRFPPSAADSDDKNTFNTKRMFPQFQNSGPKQKNAYLCSGFAFLQSFVDRGIMAVVANVSSSVVFPLGLQTSDNDDENLSSAGFEYSPLTTFVQQFPYPSYLNDPFQNAIAGTLPLFMVLSWMFPCQSIVRQIVFEKEKRLRESMKMMGLRNWVNWLGWFIKSFLYMFISVIMVTIVSKEGKILENSDAGVIFFFYLFFCIATICFSFLISVFFSKSKIAAAFGTIIYFFAYFPYFFIQPRYDDMTAGAKTMSCLLSSTCLGMGANIFAEFEAQSVGITFDNIRSTPSVDDNFSLSNVIGMFVFDSFLYLTLAWYIEGVFPGEFGIPQKWYFPFQPSYWCGRTSVSNTIPLKPTSYTPLLGSNKARSDDNDDDGEEHEAPINPENFEPEPVGLRAGIKIDGLVKAFDKKFAVNHLSLNMYEGQITALLGHNGAGKTTTMSIITGMIPPTAGTAYIDGHDILTNLDAARNSIGLCPQHDILFDSLTVHEHLDFYASLKGVPKEQLEEEITNMIADLGFTDKTNNQADTLSGGMKRKLSVAIALIGGSRIVILDEPTAGMDPYARRATWDLLLRHKANRTILLTTHYMDEADIMGDRIAIMANGKLRCIGTSLFLKSRYGIGYHMTLVKESGFKAQSVTAVVTSHIASASVTSDVGAEISFLLPTRESGNFAGLFSELESRKAELGIGSFGVSITTLEEVFLKVGEGFDLTIDEVRNQTKKSNGNYDHSHNHSYNDGSLIASGAGPSTALPSNNLKVKGYGSSSSSSNSYNNNNNNYNNNNKETDLLIPVNDNGPSRDQYNSGWQLKKQQFLAMFFKRYTISRREKKQVIMQLILPMLFVLMALIAAKTYPAGDSDPALLFDVSRLGNSVNRFAGDSSYSGSTTAFYTSQYLKSLSSSQITVSNVSLALPNATSDYISYILNLTPTPKDVSAFYRKEYGMIFTYETDASNVPNVGSAITGNVIFDSVLYNNNGYHDMVMYLNALSNAQLRFFAQASLGGNNATFASQFSISTTNFPLPLTAAESASQTQEGAASLALGFNVLFGLSFLASSFVLFLVQERMSKAKHLQFISGVNAVSYWLATFCWDLVNFLVPTIAIIIVIAAFGVDGFSGENMALAFLLIVLYGWAIIPFSYGFSFLFKLPMNAYSFTVAVYSITGLGSLIASFVLDIESLGLQDYNDKLKWAYLVLPNYCLGRGFMDIYQNENFKAACDISPAVAQSCRDAGISWVESMTSWEDPGLAKKFLFMAFEGLIGIIVVILIEYRFFISARFVSGIGAVDADEDRDVAAERLRVTSGEAERKGDTVVIKNLTKLYKAQGDLAKTQKHLVAVNELCVGIPAGECFGLLGVNGAGKTTTFKMLTGDETVSSGDAFLAGFSILREPEEVRRRIGYCPQFDALIDLLTGRELMALYARLRGVPEYAVFSLVDSLIDRMNLTKHANKPCGTYSGGNKRKLSTALALVGDPQVVFLDEMSAGIDVAGRRFLWDFISGIMRHGRSIILTSHSMEECEALCTRLAIMVNGEFKCIGSPQHLKNRFGSGYSMVVKVKRDPSRTEVDTFSIKQFVRETFTGAKLKEEHQGTLHFEILPPEAGGNNSKQPVQSLSWAFIFSKMEEAKSLYPIEDYGVSQTSLEQVFIEFARRQRSEDN